MGTDEKDPTDYGQPDPGVAAAHRRRMEQSAAVRGAARCHMVAGGALGRLLAFYGRNEAGLGGDMQPIDGDTLTARLKGLAEVYGAREPSKAALTVWGNVLKGCPIEDIADAFSYWERHKSKMPTPAEIHLLACDIGSKRREERAGQDKSQYASGANRILCDPRVASENLAKMREILGKRLPTDGMGNALENRERMLWH